MPRSDRGLNVDKLYVLCIRCNIYVLRVFRSALCATRILELDTLRKAEGKENRGKECVANYYL